MNNFTNRIRLFAGTGLAAFLLLAAEQANAQCPVTAFCNPTNPPATNLSFGIGIRNVSLGSIDNTTAANSVTGTQNGYQNFSCTIGTTLTAAVSYPVSITTGPNTTENVRVYIDYNNDGVFTLPGELAFSSNNALVHTGNITPPASAVTNTPLRMRVVSEFTGASVLPSPCVALEYGQAEDYHVIVQPNTAPANPDFTTNEPFTCDGTVNFTDQSQNVPTSWSWDFGDPASGAGNTSVQQNPTHTFSAPGTYTISLTACNANGCSTMVKTNYITYNSALPLAAACTPQTQSYCCGYGISNVTIAGINNSSADGIAGYQDFTCPARTDLVVGLSYPISITTSSNNSQNTGVWIDYNNDGIFTANENVLSAPNAINPSGNISIPATAVLNTPLRMRVISDFAGSTLGPCTNPQNGQAEDYTVTIVPNIFPPVAAFGISPFATCDTVRQFTNNTQINLSSPATTYTWHFGDGTTSNAVSPSHAYSSAANMYTVSLVACNSFGCDSMAFANVVTIDNPCLNYCIPANNINTSQWISQVEYGLINNSTGANAGGYGNFANISTPIVRGETNNFTVSLGSGLNRAVSIWIDYDRNGIFEITERVFNGQTQLLPSGFRGVTGSITIPPGTEIGAARMRVIMRTIANNTDPCISNAANTDVEDYTVILQQPVPVIPGTEFSSIQAGICNGVVNFIDETLHLPTSWTWDFGDGSPTVNTQNPTHTYQVTTPASYTVTLTTCNAVGCSTIVKPNHVVITVPCTIPYCISLGHNNSSQHISRVTAGSIDNTSGAANNGYSNFTSQSTELLIGSLSFLSVNLQNSAVPWGIAVWIDLNQNANFEPTERVFIGQSNQLPGGQYGTSGYFSIPAGSVPGPTRMRVIAREGPNFEPCVMNLGSGEVEDYTVNLVTVASIDVGVLAITSPVSGCTLSATSQVCIQVKNYGSTPQTDIPVQFNVGAFQSAIEIIPGTLAPGDTVSYCFTTTANLSAPGFVNIIAQTMVIGDAQTFNNSRNLPVGSFPLPNASFNYTPNGLAYTFNSASVASSTYSWNFGDGTTSTLANPQHTFPAAGNYTVTLTVTSNNGCVSSTTQTLMGVSSIEDIIDKLISIYPNPTAGVVQVRFPENEAVIVEITNALGQEIHRSIGINGNKQVDLSNTAKGMYTVKVYMHNGAIVRKLVVL